MSDPTSAESLIRTLILEERLRLTDAYLRTMGAAADLVSRIKGIPFVENRLTFPEWIARMCGEARRQVEMVQAALPSAEAGLTAAPLKEQH